MRKILATMAMAMTFLYAATVLSETLPKPPIGLENMGLVDSVDRAGRMIVINDSAYQLADYVIVHSLNNRSISIRRLKSGDKIRFAPLQTNGGGSSNPVITEIWLLPAFN